MSSETPTISAREQRKWNKLSEHMDHFHQGFQRDFNNIYEWADGSFNQLGLSLLMFLQIADGLISHLNMHHSIEERYFFPKLAAKMPSFKGEHIKSHKGIHKGLDALQILVTKYKGDLNSYDPAELRACLDSFREVLFRHLDEEVADLQGENLRKYFTLAEVERMM
ncbi:hypothetical protein FIBSPDRAFT_924091 [Athelia psychrophila]|uniref:Hemerythrin-like domain-containing protein n=1 Tax=Athelia psychrophila TaxID=1759441 RepID=A0A166XCJ3_9AGAM|nr:hypothetical protein FIBSPDRAFT_924091 [Fibularhizoctonia sp. CBS 109695]